MFSYCLNNPVVLVDTSGTAAHIGFSADGQLHYAPWKIGSPGGGGWSQDIHYTKKDYGSVADKFLTVRAIKFVGYCFSTPENAYKTLAFVGVCLEAAAAGCVKVGLVKTGFVLNSVAKGCGWIAVVLSLF